MKWKVDASHVTLNGDIDERAAGDLEDLPAKVKAEHVVLDCAQVRRINSIGVLGWINFLTDLKKKHSFEFINCPATFINYLNLTRTFAAGGNVVSFAVPYQCKSCHKPWHTVMQTASVGKNRQLSSAPCPACGKNNEAEVLGEDYLGFLDD